MERRRRTTPPKTNKMDKFITKTIYQIIICLAIILSALIANKITNIKDDIIQTISYNVDYKATVSQMVYKATEVGEKIKETKANVEAN